MSEKKRVNIMFERSAHDALAELASQKNTTMTQVVKDAIGLECWFRGVHEEGGRVVAEYPDGRRYEVVRPWQTNEAERKP